VRAVPFERWHFVPLARAWNLPIPLALGPQDQRNGQYRSIPPLSPTAGKSPARRPPPANYSLAACRCLYYGNTVTTLSFKVSRDQARAIRAREERLTVSEFLRRQAVAQPRPAAVVALRLCPVTGATIFDGADDLPPLTVESTREMLADVP